MYITRMFTTGSFFMNDSRTDIFLAGDSTMCFYTRDHAPLTGWGMVLPQFCRDSVRVHNFAQGGHSTRHFQNSGWLSRIFETVRPGDHLVIQFGHNDKHPADYRPLAHTEVEEFSANLHSWIKTSREIGVTPTLVTTTVEWAENGPDERAALLARYNDATRETATECGVDLIDLNSFAYAELSKLPMPEIHRYHMATSGVAGREKDFCHLKRNGAELYASWFVGLCKQQGAKIARCFK